MTFEQATKFTQIDWEQPEHDEKRNEWAASRSKVKSISPRDKKDLGVIKNTFNDGVKNDEAVGTKTTKYHSTLDDISKEDDPEFWKHYKKYINPDQESKI